MIKSIQSRGCFKKYNVQLFQNQVCVSVISLNYQLPSSPSRIMRVSIDPRKLMVIKYYSDEDSILRIMASFKLFSSKQLISKITPFSKQFDFILFPNALVYFRQKHNYVKQGLNEQRSNALLARLSSLGYRIINRDQVSIKSRYHSEEHLKYQIEELGLQLQFKHHSPASSGHPLNHSNTVQIGLQKGEGRKIYSQSDNEGDDIGRYITLCEVIALAKRTKWEELLEVALKRLGEEGQLMCFEALESYYQSREQTINQINTIKEILRLNQSSIIYRLKLGKLYLSTNLIQEVTHLMPTLPPKSLGYLELNLLLMLNKKQYIEVELRCNKVIDYIRERPNDIPSSDCYPFHQILYKLFLYKNPLLAKEQIQMMEVIVQSELKATKRPHRRQRLERKLAQISMMNTSIELNLGNYNKSMNELNQYLTGNLKLYDIQICKIQKLKKYIALKSEKRIQGHGLWLQTGKRDIDQEIHKSKWENQLGDQNDLRWYQLQIISLVHDYEGGRDHKSIEEDTQLLLQMVKGKYLIAPNYFRRLEYTANILLVLVSDNPDLQINQASPLHHVCSEMIDEIQKSKVKSHHLTQEMLQKISSEADELKLIQQNMKSLQISHSLRSYSLPYPLHVVNESRINMTLAFFSQPAALEHHQPINDSQRLDDDMLGVRDEGTNQEQKINEMREQLYTLSDQLGTCHPNTLLKSKQLGEFCHLKSQMFLSVVYLVHYHTQTQGQEVVEIIKQCIECLKQDKQREIEYFSFGKLWEQDLAIELHAGLQGSPSQIHNFYLSLIDK